MNRHSPEPLTQEERELAQLIARTGPHGEPPTALDAKILAAAHAAVNSKPLHGGKPRWPVAIGLAASMVLAIGIAWQLRPVQPAAPLVSEAPAMAAAETAAQTEAEPASEVGQPLHADAVAQDSAAAADVPMPAPPPPPAAKPMPSRTVPMPPPPLRAARVPPPQAPPVQRQAQDGDRYRSLNAVPPPPAPPAPVMAAPEPATESPAAFAPDPRDGVVGGSLSANEAAGYSTARTAAAKQSADRGEAKASAAIREQERDTLDRIEVTGSRLQRTDLQVPVSNDAQLPVEEWLERVRTRYGLGDAEAAKRSLLLFVKDHPDEAVPGDLEPLLEK
jgi:Meckel syndrome type 1 protein